MQRTQVLFLVKFFAILIAAYLLIAWNPVNDNVIVPFTKGVAQVSGALLNAIGQKVTTTGTIISSPKFGVNINNGCNGVEAMLILLASIVAFPASMKARAADCTAPLATSPGRTVDSKFEVLRNGCQSRKRGSHGLERNARSPLVQDAGDRSRNLGDCRLRRLAAASRGGAGRRPAA